MKPLTREQKACAIEFARADYAESYGIKIADRPKVSRVVAGVWVQAWAWVPKDELRFIKSEVQ